MERNPNINLTKQQKIELLQQIEKELYRKSFFEFVKKACTILEPGTVWDWNFHHEYLCDILQSTVERIVNKIPKKDGDDLIINIPFRSSKSLIVSVCLPVWAFTTHQNISFINLSYSDGLATDSSNKVSALLNSIWIKQLYQPQYSDVHRGKTDFELTNGCYRLSAGFKGSVLGRGADIIVCDDPNSPKDLSEVGRNAVIDIWKNTIRSRLNNPSLGVFIVIQQRLHKNDLSGYLLENFSEKWTHVCLPAIQTDKVKPILLIEKYKDGLLWPTRFTTSVLKDFKEVLGSIMFSNQLQQEAYDDEGNIIKRDWIKIISKEDFDKLISIHKPKTEMYIDSAYTKDKKNDASGILITNKINNDIYVKKCYNIREEFPELIKTIKNIYIKHNVNIGYIEPKANGLSIIQTLKRETKLNITSLPSPKDDKETRLKAASPYIESNRLILVEDISNEEVLKQLTGFPNETHDEVVDIVSYAITKNMGSSFNYAM